MSLVSIKDILNNGYSGIFVFLLSLVCISFGISIIVTRNPVVSVLFLIGLFVTVAIILMTLGLNFVGLSYLLVYVGAVSILFLFILMLINIRTSELTTEGKNSLLLAIIAVISFNFIVNNILPYCVYIYDAFSSSLVYTYIQNFKNLFLSMFNAYAGTDGITKLFLEISRSSKEGFVFSKSWEGYLIENSHISAIGNILYSNLSILLIIVSLILLLAMVGTIIITMKRINNVKENLLSSFFLEAFTALGSLFDLISYTVNNIRIEPVLNLAWNSLACIWLAVGYAFKCTVYTIYLCISMSVLVISDSVDTIVLLSEAQSTTSKSNLDNKLKAKENNNRSYIINLECGFDSGGFHILDRNEPSGAKMLYLLSRYNLVWSYLTINGVRYVVMRSPANIIIPERAHAGAVTIQDAYINSPQAVSFGVWARTRDTTRPLGNVCSLNLPVHSRENIVNNEISREIFIRSAFTPSLNNNGS